MSLILDALRKMEQDRVSRRGAPLHIRPAVLRYRGGGRPQRQPPTFLPVLIAVALVACGVGAGIFLKESEHHSVARRNPTVVPVLPGEGGVSPAATSVVRPVSPPPAEIPVPASAASLSPVQKRVAAHLTFRLKSAEPSQALAVRRETPIPTGENPLPASDITVSGIAWQDERSLRRAVVNGVLVGEGAEIAGARVSEIREDRVRLTRGGELIEALYPVGSSSR